jgi:DNA-binding response OmpR family regulator
VLNLVDGDGDPPAPGGCLEDWVRLPGDRRDVAARVAALAHRAITHRAPPRVDEAGELHYGGDVVPLPPGEARIARVLAVRFGEVVPDGDLAAALVAGDPSVRRLVTRLRARLRTVSLFLSRRRRQGYVLRDAQSDHRPRIAAPSDG